MTRFRTLNKQQLDDGMAWINSNLTQFRDENNAAYWYSRCLDKLGGLMSLHTRTTTGKKHWFRARLEKTFEPGSECVANSYLHPPSRITKPGRANIAGCPVLYVSDSLDDCLQEIGCISPGDTARVSLIEYNGVMELAQFLFPKNIHQLGVRTAALATQFFDPFSKTMSGYSALQKEMAFHLHWSICEEYLSKRHFFSSLVSWNLIYRHGGIDGIIYPSTHSLQTVNFALSAIASSKCKILRCFKVCISADGNIQIISVGIVSEQSTIEWQDPTEGNLNLSGHNIAWNHDKNYRKIIKTNTNGHSSPPPTL